MEKLNIKIILGSIRSNRFGDKPANWLLAMMQKIDGVAVEILDLKDYQLPIFSEPVSPNYVQGEYPNSAVNVWAKKIAEADGFVFVTPEYNHGYPPSLKNNIDHLGKEWHQKPAAFVAYGSVGGARAVEQLRQVVAELQMASVRNAVHINNPWNLVEADGSLKSGVLDEYENSAKGMIDQLLWWTKALKNARTQG
jgi:NAD(P)H-dependent FMN reductase